MSDEQPKKVPSVPPPPTEALDKAWSNTPDPGKVAERTAAAPIALPTQSTHVRADKRQHGAELRDEEELDEDEDEFEEDEEDDEDGDEEASVRPASRASRAEGSKDWLPDWAPWAVLGGLVVLGVVGGLGGLGTAAPRPRAIADAPTAAAPKAGASPERREAAPRPAGTAAAAAAADTETIEASHLLVAYQGARRADPKVTRSKEDAKKRAQEAAGKAKKGAPFDKLVAEYSDEPRAAERKGSLGSFSRRQMVKPFADAAFALKPGQISDVVETDFGFHVILRSK